MRTFDSIIKRAIHLHILHHEPLKFALPIFLLPDLLERCKLRESADSSADFEALGEEGIYDVRGDIAYMTESVLEFEGRDDRAYRLRL